MKIRFSIKNIRAFFWVWLIGFFVFFNQANAQTDQSPLKGKTIHVYNPFVNSLPLVNLSGAGYAMTDEGGNWYRFTFDSTGLQAWMKDFGIRTGDWKWLTPTGVGTKEGVFGLDVFGSGLEAWVVVDPSGPITAPPLILTSAPRTVHVFNPWPFSGPEMVIGGVTRPMLNDKNHCGWNIAYILQSGPVTGYFKSAADGEAWGKGGLDDKTPFDFGALFTANGSDIWIDSTRNVSSSFPGTIGSCSYLMATTVHDMAETHPDYGGGGGGIGMVQKALGADKKPVPTTSAPGHFNTWFNSDPNAAMPLKGSETCLDLQMGKSDDGLWEFDSNNGPSQEFFPLDDFNTLDKNASCSNDPNPPVSSIHNYGFCLESHASFVYKKGQVFQFRGDDDVWVFINNKLSLDLGGIHAALDGSINLDTLGLTDGQTYPWDFFFCERNKCSSSLRIKTTIYFKQQRALDHVKEVSLSGGTNYRVIKRIGGSGACGSSSDSLKEVPPGPLTFVLYKVAGDSIQVLPKGTSFGGIVVTDNSVQVDTSKVIGLASGPYRIVFYETSNPKLRDEIQFTVSAHNTMVFESPLVQSTQLGKGIRLIAGNHYQANGKDSLVAGSVAWTPVFPNNLMVYGDSLRNGRVTPNSVQMTAATGLDTLWAFGDTTSLTDQTYTLSIPGSNKATVTFTLPPLDLPKVVSATLFDDDGDGRGDRLVAVYDRNITSTLPVSIAYRWPATGSPIPLTNMASHLKGGDSLVFSGSPFSQTILTSGSGVFESTYRARSKDSLQSIPLLESMAPVITEATIHLGMVSDTLRIAFSEPLSSASRSLPTQDLFGYQMGNGGLPLAIMPLQTLWSTDGQAVQLIFTSNSSPEPKAGDFVRLNPGPGLASDAGNHFVGSQTRFRLITGAKRIGIQSLTFKEFSSDKDQMAGPIFHPALQSTGATIADVVSQTGLMGHLLEVDLADYAVGDGFTAPPPSEVFLEYDVAIFSNLGIPVASEKRSLACTDAVYQGDCLTHRGRLFVAWNYGSHNHQKVGTGAYVVVFRFRIISQGKLLTDNSKREIWGLLRAN